MFSVFSKSGRIFTGSMEELGKLAPVGAMARTGGSPARLRSPGRGGARQRPEGGAAPGFIAPPDPYPEPDSSSSTDPAGLDLPHRTALAAYASTGQDDPARHPLSTVADIMSDAVVTLSDQVAVGDAWASLMEHGLGQAPVVDQHDVLVGLLSRADLMRADRLPGPHAHALVWTAFLLQPVAEVMVTPVPSVEPETDIRRVARVLIDTGLPGLPVADQQGRVIGFVSRTDILRAVATDPPLDLWG